MLLVCRAFALWPSMFFKQMFTIFRTGLFRAKLRTCVEKFAPIETVVEARIFLGEIPQVE